MQTRKQILDSILAEGIIAIVRLKSGEHLVETAQAIAAGGVKVIEFTLNTPGAIPAIRECATKHPDIIIGAGTVLNDQAVKQAVESGAQFIVSPNTKATVIEMTHHYGKVAIPGAYTPNEIATAMDLYADIIKLFPAHDLGPNYIRNLKGPYNDLNIMPTGGVNDDNIHDYFQAGACAVAVGTQVYNDSLVEVGNFEEITRRARKFKDTVDAARGELAE